MIGLGLGPTFQLGRGGGGGAWTPANLTDTWDAWFDAQDAATITLDGSNVSGMLDKSGVGNDLSQNFSSLRPQYDETGFEGLPALRNIGSRFLTRADAAVLQGVSGAMILAAVIMPSGVGYGNNASPVFVSSGTSNSSTRFSINFRPNSASRTGMGIRRADSDAFQPVPGNTENALLEGFPNLIAVQMDYATGLASQWINGAPDLIDFPTALATGVTSSTASRILGLFAGATSVVMTPTGTIIGEVLIARRVLTDVERGLVEGYLSAKWAIDLA